VDHPKVAGKPGPKKNPIFRGEAYEYLGKTPRGHKTARKKWLKAMSERRSSAIETKIKGKINTPPGKADVKNSANQPVA